ncbi:NAD(P)-binding protein [Suhomyces tanzawaensis NRRL Y-17324]|uniref:NAD(P)-binding protein n=1 Tax=Suhomyces tanzawaensis NRRL Y-17324 TaxID=984487 RepID=A0A1E4SEF0_9ASCO|nr:NAD(P)-binding protein [Suhomyces tanzawaensis NRRL Y-17324]ODV77887.1 NAD(P)-binding protein [Suhomyces tanzawaensis NRRL Y-17324]
MSTNQAVLSGILESGKFTKVIQRPFPVIDDDQILVKAVAFAANPTDWKHAVYQIGHEGDIAGSDASGIVEQVGKNVKGFEVGDIVSSFMHGNFSTTRGAFSQHFIADPVTTIRYDKTQIKNTQLPVGVTPSGTVDTFEGAASVTLSLTTVAFTFADSFKVSYDKSKNANKTVLIWGGATSTGIIAIQVAKEIYGLNVIATASKKNHEFLLSLGADQVFDYNDSNVIEDVKKAANGSIAYAYDTVSSEETFQQTYDATEGSPDVILENLMNLSEDLLKLDSSRKVTFSKLLAYVADGRTHHVFGHDFVATPESLKNYNQFWNDIVPDLIKTIKTPNLKVLESGLESANEALALVYENRVSAQKVVFRP